MKWILRIKEATKGFDRVCLVGYNLKKYDIPLLELELLRHGVDCQLKDIADDVIDLYEVVQDKEVWEASDFDKPESLKLGDVYHAVLDKALSNAHSGLGDVKGVIEIMAILDPKLSVASKFVSPLSYSGVDLEKLPRGEREIAKASLCKSYS